MAAVLLVAQFCWRGVYLWRGYYVQDDFLMLRLGKESGLTWSYLMQEYSGHVWPGNFLVAWIAVRIDPNAWWLTATTVLLLQVACGALMWVLLGRILDDARLRICVFIFYLTCPLTLWATQWWASAIGFLPLSFCMLLAVWGALRRFQDDWKPGSAVVVMAMVGGLAFQERAVLYTLVVGGVSVLSTPGSLTHRLRIVACRYRWLWLTLVALTIGFLALHSVLAPIRVSGNTGVDGPGRLAFDYFLRNLLPGLAGGPWALHDASNAYVAPTSAAAAIGSAITLGFVTMMAVKTDLTGRFAMLWLAAYAAADLGLLFGGRTQFEALLGLVPRYAADVVPVAALAMAYSLSGVKGWQSGHVGVASSPSRRAPRAPTVLTAVYVCTAIFATELIAPLQQNEVSRHYVTTLRAELREHPNAVIYDRPVPTDVMVNFFPDQDRRLSTVLAWVPESPVFDLASHRLLIPDDSGLLREPEAALLTSRTPPPSHGSCGYRVTPQGAPALVGLPSGAGGRWYVLQLDYFSGGPGLLEVSGDASEHVVRIRKGSHSVYVVLERKPTLVTLKSLEGGTACVVGVSTWFPRQALQ